MIRDKTCIHDGYSFVFLKKKVNFEKAKQECDKVGANLMQDFNRDTILKLEQCCKFKKTAPAYWIGLRKSPDCPRSRMPYQMVHNRTCVSELSMTVSSHLESHDCIALALIPPKTNDTHPGVIEQNCNKTMSYACQFMTKEMPIFQTVSTTSTLNATTTAIFQTASTTSTVNATTTAPPEMSRKMIYIGIGALAAFLFILVTATAFFVNRKRKQAKQKRCTSRSSNESTLSTINGTMTTDETSEEIYCTVDYRPHATSNPEYYVSNPNLYSNLGSFYEQPDSSRQNIIQTGSYLYMELDEPIPFQTDSMLGTTPEPNDDFDTGEYVRIRRDIIPDNNDYLQPISPAGCPTEENI